MRSLFIEPSGAGGIAHYTYYLTRALAKAGVACDVLTSTRWNSPVAEGVRVFKIFRGMRTSVMQLFKLCIALRHDVDLVHWQSTTHPRMLLALMSLIPLKTHPWIYTVHNVLPHEQTPKSMRQYEKIYRRMQALIFHTEFSRHQYPEFFPQIQRPSTIIPIGEFELMEGEPLPLAPDAGKKILFFGNIRPYKGLDILLQAMPQVLRAVPDAKLIIAGQALQPFPPYEELIQNLKLQECTTTQLGYIPNAEVPRILSQAQIMALPYKSIDQSAVLFLGMGQGKTLVASDVGGLSEVIRANETGILVEAENPEALALGLIEVLTNEDRAIHMGLAARDDIRNRFSWDAIAKNTLSFYQEILRHE